MARVHGLHPFPQGLWGIKSSSKTWLLGFSTMLNKMTISKFRSGDLGKKEQRRGHNWPPILWSLKNGTRTSNFRSNEPSCGTLGLLG